MVNSVLIVGLGNVGMMYDVGPDKGKAILTHAKAFHSHSAFKLIGGVDPDPERRRLFQYYYKIDAFESIHDALKATTPSVVVVAVPTEQHFSIINQVLSLGNPAAILCEKPISFDIGEASEIVAICKEMSCALFVNYMRRSDVGINEVFERLEDGRIKYPVRGMVWYSKGLFNSASHFINLLQFLLGEVKGVKRFNAGRFWEGRDPEPDFEVSFVHGTICFFALCAENFFHNSMELIAENGRLRYENGGAQIIWENIDSNKVFSGYTTLGSAPESLVSDFFRVQWHVANQLAVSLSGESGRICTGEDALHTQNVLAQIQDYV